MPMLFSRQTPYRHVRRKHSDDRDAATIHTGWARHAPL